MEKSALEEMIQFLEPSARLDVKSMALQHIVSLTATSEGVTLVDQVPPLYKCLLALLTDTKGQASVRKDAALAFINLTGDQAVCQRLLDDLHLDFVASLWQCVSDPESTVADPACMILSNLTIDKVCCDLVADTLKAKDITLDKVIYVFCQEGYNQASAKLHYLGPFLSNLSQLEAIRQAILDRSGCVIQRLLPFTEYKASRVRRGGIVGTLRNCCFEPKHHEWLLSEEVDILPRLLLPLAGPTPETLEPEDIEKLPLDLQYLDEDKTMEEDPDIRKMLLEALTQLCATRKCREIIRGQSTYFILKELHKVEKDRTVRLACENLVDILIKKEEEINVENYHDVEVPSEMVPELEQMDKEYLKE